jgi:Icc-related predicted phosphoesterase
MRILAIADIHGALSVYKWLLGLISEEQADVVVLAGDLLIGAWEDEQREQCRESIIPLLKKMPIPVLYIMGNDDHIALEYENGQIKPIHGRRLDLGGYGFVGYQYSPPFMGGIFEKLESEIEADTRILGPLLDDHTVLVTHSPAYGSCDQTYSGERVGSHSLADLLERRPVLAHVHGHIHHSFGRDGNHFNVAAAGECRGFLIDLPGLSHKVVHR